MKQTNWQKKHWGFYLGGLRMRIIDADYDFVDAVSVAYKDTKQMRERMQAIMQDYNRGFDMTEYDCNGSTECRCSISRRGGVLRLVYRERKDV